MRAPLSLSLLLSVIFLSWTSSVTAETHQLTEEKVIERALAQNLGVKITETERAMGEAQIMAAQAPFDTLLSAEINHLIDKSEKTSIIFGTDNSQTNWNLGIARRFATGTQASLQWLNRRETTNSTFTTFNPNYESIVELAITQPLLNNFFGYQDRGRVSVARKNFASLDHRSQRVISEQVFQVLGNYWRWLTNRRIETVTARSLKEAKHFEEVSKEKEKFGLHESTDVLASQANRLLISNQLLLVREQKNNTLGQLRRDLNLDKASSLSSKEEIYFETELPELAGVLSTALMHRPEYLAAKNDVENQKLQVSLAKNSLWPQLDLLASLQANGVRADYGDSAETAAGFGNPSFFVGGQFQWALENRLARSDRDKAELAKARALYQLKNVEHQVSQNVEEQWRQLQTSVQTVQTNRRIEQLQRNKWQEELKKYRTGRSSSDIVIRYQEDYLNAQRITLESLFNYRIALLGLRLAQNVLLP
jgi:outer membrane protein TolC